jgi:hypothetical protein
MKIWTSRGVPRKASTYAEASHGRGFGRKNLTRRRMEPSVIPMRKARSARDRVVGMPHTTYIKASI